MAPVRFAKRFLKDFSRRSDKVTAVASHHWISLADVSGEILIHARKPTTDVHASESVSWHKNWILLYADHCIGVLMPTIVRLCTHPATCSAMGRSQEVSATPSARSSLRLRIANASEPSA